MEAKSRYFLVVCAFNEERNICSVINSVPSWIDHIVVVNDGSSDRTSLMVASSKPYTLGNVSIVEHKENQGQGAARSSGVKFIHEILNKDSTHNSSSGRRRKVMNDYIFFIDGDGQMQASDLLRMKNTFVKSNADFVKAERLNSSKVTSDMPRVRLIGNLILSLLTKIASGNWTISDSQSGFFGLTIAASRQINWPELPKRFGQINSITIEAAINDWRVSNFNIEPVYGVGEESKLVPHKVALPILYILLRGYFRRIVFHRLIWNSHPLALFHIFSWILGAGAIGTVPYLVWTKLSTGAFPILSTYAFLFLITLSTVSFFHAMQLDYQESVMFSEARINK